jgi:phage terminase large subunit
VADKEIESGYLTLDCCGNDKQREFALAYNDDSITEIGVFGCKGSGKSYFAISLLFGSAFLYPGTIYFIARNELNDLRKYNSPDVYKVLDNWQISSKRYKYNGKDDFWQLDNGSKIFYLHAGYLPRDPEFKRFGSRQCTRLWIEEAGELEYIAKRNLCGTAGRWKNTHYNLKRKIILTGNPCQNFIYEYYKQWKLGKLAPYIKFIETDIDDNKAIDDGYYEGLEQSFSQAEKERLLYNNWEYSNDPALLCQSSAIQDLFKNEHIKPTDDNYLSSDLAMQGRDLFVSAPWKGLVCDLREAVVKQTTGGKDIELDIKNLMIKHSVPRSQSVADSDGMGNYLESYLEGIREFHAGSPALNNIEFANLKAECAYKLAELINKRLIRILFEDNDQKERIIRELNVLKSEAPDDDERRKRIISKKKMKKLLGFSPDYLDMLIMRMVFELYLKPDMASCQALIQRPDFDELLGLEFEDFEGANRMFGIKL